MTLVAVNLKENEISHTSDKLGYTYVNGVRTKFSLTKTIKWPNLFNGVIISVSGSLGVNGIAFPQWINNNLASFDQSSPQALCISIGKFLCENSTDPELETEGFIISISVLAANKIHHFQVSNLIRENDFYSWCDKSNPRTFRVESIIDLAIQKTDYQRVLILTGDILCFKIYNQIWSEVRDSQPPDKIMVNCIAECRAMGILTIGEGVDFERISF